MLKGNIADDPEDDLEVPTIAPGPSNCQQTVHDKSFRSVAPPQADFGVAPATSSASALRIVLTTSLATDKQEFSPQSIGRLKALMSKENRTKTLIKVGAEEASTRFNAHISQDEANYDGDISHADEEDIEVVPDEVDDTQIKGSKPVEADTVIDKVPEATNKEMAAKARSLQTRNQLKNTATGPHLELEMVRSAKIGTWSQGQVSQGPYLHSLHSEGRPSAPHEFFRHSQGGKENVKHLLPHRHHSCRWVNSAGWQVAKCTLVPRHT